jgi:hypothetical protein
MAYFAEIDEENKVLRVLAVDDLHEEDGQNFLANELGLGGRWIQTSYNRRIRKNYAGIGMFYDEARDAFIYEQPFNSWILNNDTCQWEPPTPNPSWVFNEETGVYEPSETRPDKFYVWEEETLSWIEIQNI